ncbi:hypothetical protein [Gluconobacter potus]|uniref:hypothetical protein n=1 Tax=Gluconobacter potus TaxID=2724927 RepID=UPI0039EB7192
MSQSVSPVAPPPSCVTIDSLHPINSVSEVLYHFKWWAWLILALTPVIYVGAVIVKKGVQDATKDASEWLAVFLTSCSKSVVEFFKKAAGKSSVSISDSQEGTVTSINETPISWMGAFLYSYFIYAICAILVWDVQRTIQVAVASYAALPMMTLAVRALQRKWFTRFFDKDGFLEKFLFVDIVFLFLCLTMMLSLLITRIIFLYPMSLVLSVLHGQ